MGRHRSRSLSSEHAAESSKWDGVSGHRIHVADLPAGISRREIERAFEKYGSINEVWVATNPPCFAFINFTNRTDAENAIREVDGKIIGSSRVGVSWARNRTFGGRNRGGRSAPFGSYRTRHRSRSRSRSNSRREKRRHSRSRSRDRHRRRSNSPRDRKHSRRTSEEKSRRKTRTPSKSPSGPASRGQSRDVENTKEPNTQNQSLLNINDE